jgi:hypothetical protein
MPFSAVVKDFFGHSTYFNGLVKVRADLASGWIWSDFGVNQLFNKHFFTHMNFIGWF